MNDTANQKTKAEISEFLSGQMMGEVASVNEEGRPQAATVAFYHTDDLGRFIIGTSDTSRKAKNLTRDGRVAFVVTDLATRCTVQFDGTARQLTPEESEELVDKYYQKLPFLAATRTTKGRCHFVLEPHWLRFTDIAATPWSVTEITL